jgi:Flp pilus assembly protein TadG
VRSRFGYLLRLASAGRFRRSETAAAAIEFAIVGPVFIFLMFAMIAYGIYLGATHSVEQLAADAARVAIAGLDREERLDLVEKYIDRNAGDYMLLERENVKAEIQDSPSDPTQFKVFIEYDASTLPIWNLYQPLPLPSRTITRASTIRVGGI